MHHLNMIRINFENHFYLSPINCNGQQGEDAGMERNLSFEKSPKTETMLEPSPSGRAQTFDKDAGVNYV